MKTCAICKIKKTPDEFSKDSQKKDGLNTYCRKCRSRSRMAWEKDNPQKVILFKSKARAKKRGLPFNLEIEDVVIPEKCPILGIKLKRGKGTGGSVASSPSLDRIVPEKGYTKGNVQVISMRANQIKSDATADELMAVAKYCKEHENDV